MSVGCPTMGWNDAAAEEKDVVISSGVIVIDNLGGMKKSMSGDKGYLLDL